MYYIEQLNGLTIEELHYYLKLTLKMKLSQNNLEKFVTNQRKTISILIKPHQNIRPKC